MFLKQGSVLTVWQILEKYYNNPPLDGRAVYFLRYLPCKSRQILKKYAIKLVQSFLGTISRDLSTIFEFIKLSNRPPSITESKSTVELSHPASTKAVTTWIISAHSYYCLRRVTLAGKYDNAQYSLLKMHDWRSLKNKRFTISPMSLTFQ